MDKREQAPRYKSAELDRLLEEIWIEPKKTYKDSADPKRAEIEAMITEFENEHQHRQDEDALNEDTL